MSERDFVYWLQGFFELSGDLVLDTKQCEIIKDHLALVLEKKTPERSQLYVPNIPIIPYREGPSPMYVPPGDSPFTWETTSICGDKTYENNFYVDKKIKTHLTC